MTELDKKIMGGSASDNEVNQYLLNEGIDPEQVAHEGSVFIRVLTEKIRLEDTYNALDKAHQTLSNQFQEVRKDRDYYKELAVLADKIFAGENDLSISFEEWKKLKTEYESLKSKLSSHE